ncbi:hypothetical protein D9M70_564210 [compost metagenome]
MTFDQLLDRQHGPRGPHPRCALHFQLPVLELALLEQGRQARDGAGLVPARTAQAGVIALQFLGVVFRYLAAAPGGALQAGVVDHHQLAVAGQVQVQFATLHAM